MSEIDIDYMVREQQDKKRWLRERMKPSRPNPPFEPSVSPEKENPEKVNTDTSGGTRYSKGKPSGWHMLPLLGLKLIAPVGKDGGEKYAPQDWKEGQMFSTLMDSGTRHFLEVLHHGPMAKDPESGHYHLAHATWNFLAMLTFMVIGGPLLRELDDITPFHGVTAEVYHHMKEHAEERGVPVHEVAWERRDELNDD